MMTWFICEVGFGDFGSRGREEKSREKKTCLTQLKTLRTPIVYIDLYRVLCIELLLHGSGQNTSSDDY